MSETLMRRVTASAGDTELMKAVGRELQRLRKLRKWSRPDLVRQLPGAMPVNTYACYEQGIRPCPLPRLVEICDVLGVTVGFVVDRARQQLAGGREHAATNPEQQLHDRLHRIEDSLAGLSAGQAHLLALTQRQVERDDLDEPSTGAPI